MKNLSAVYDLEGSGKSEFNRVLEQTRIKDVIGSLQDKEVYFPLLRTNTKIHITNTKRIFTSSCVTNIIFTVVVFCNFEA